MAFGKKFDKSKLKQKRQQQNPLFKRKKFCRFTAEGVKQIDYKDIDVLKLGRCIDTKATSAEVEKEIAEGRALDVNRTPTIFVNGRRISQTIDWTNLKNIIDTEIAYQKVAKNAGDDCGCEVQLPVPGINQPSPVGLTKKK